MSSEPSTTCNLAVGNDNFAGGAGVLLELSLSQSVNYAMQQNDVPVIHSLRVSNLTEDPLQDICVRIATEPAFAAPWETSLSSIGPGEVYNLGVVDLPLSHDFLSQLTERVIGAVHIQVLQGDQVIARRSERIESLAYDEWSGLSVIPEILAAFVTPNHPAIETVLSNVATLLGEWTGDSSLSGYQCKDRERIFKMVAGVYTALQQIGIRYINPPASFEERGQKIRLPDRIIENKLGTCLDLATLTAACLEQIGLHPLIAITEGHAFCGVWMDDECFADTITDDVLPLRKRVELGEVFVFETTCIASDMPVPFSQAVDMGKHHLVDTGSFRCIIDICRARKSRIRPLPIRLGRMDDLHTAMAQPIDGSAGSLGTQAVLPSLMPDIPDSPSVEAPASRLDRWKRKLLDLTMHNRLLNFRETKKTLPLLCPNLAALEDALADGEKFRLYPKPTDLDDSQPRDVGVHRRRTGEDAIEALLSEEFQAHRLRSSVPEGDLNRRLLEIYREARTSLEENGANTLYLALGFLAWYETKDSSQRRVSPIILIPLEIERRSVQEGFTICQGDDDPIVNITLLELLAKDYQLSIPGMDPIPQDDHGINVQAILNAFRKAVKMIDKWEVIEDAFIGHFSFTKFLMWRDLEVRATELRNNKVVSHLIDTPHEVFATDGTFPDADRLDDTHKPAETFCPLSADSSQLAAI